MKDCFVRFNFFINYDSVTTPAPPMKLLHVIDSMDPTVGGPCQGIRNMTRNLERLGIHSEVASVDKPDSAFLSNETLLIHALGPGKSAWGYSVLLQPWLIANLERFDIVILHGLWLYTNFATFKVVRQFKLKAIRSKKYSSPSLFIMPHGMMDPYFQRDKDRRFKAIRNYLYWHLVESKIVNGADGLFFTCVTELMVARETFTYYNPKLELNIGYGIEDPPVRSDKMMLDFHTAFPELADTSYILFFSRIHEKKALDLVVEAYLLMITNPSFKMMKIPKLVIAGPGIESEYGQKILKRVNSSIKLKKNVFFTGMMLGNMKWAVIYGCEAFILPSHQENFGIAVAEALACGKPVLISDQVNIWREIESEGGGIIQKDTLMGAETLLYEWMHMSKAEKITMTMAAYKAYENNFRIKPVVEKFAEDLREHLDITYQII